MGGTDANARGGGLRDRLAAEAGRTFVGREAELALFADALAHPAAGFAVLHVFGPGGIGKTSLLHRYAALAGAAGAEVVLLDASELDGTAAGLVGVLAAALGGDPRERGDGDGRLVLMIDSYETLAPLDAWLRRTFLPSLPEDALVVLAGRGDPAPGWSADAGWSALGRRVALRGLAPDEAAEFLRRKGIAPEAQPALVERSYGHPLALALCADAIGSEGTIAPDAELDMTAILVRRLVETAPSLLHRAALELASHALRVNEAMIAEVVDAANAGALFEWLRERPYVDARPDGLTPHDIVRRIVQDEFRFRDPDAFARMHEAARGYYFRRIVEGDAMARGKALRDSVFLHRVNPIMARYFEFRALGRTLVEPASTADHAAILAVVERHEGRRSAELARYWLDRQPEAFIAARSDDGALAGVLCQLKFESGLDPIDAAADPMLAPIAPVLATSAPRPGEAILVGRFIMAAESYQAPSAVLNALQIASYQQWMTTPRLAWSFLTVNAAEPWDSLMRYIDYAPLPSGELTIGRVRYRLFGHDWRQVDAIAWFALMEEREIDPAMRVEGIVPTVPDLVVLSRPAFADAVREALKVVHDDAALAASPLLRSRLVPPGSGGPQALRDAVFEAARTLNGRPADEKFHRALDLTYLAPIGKQEAVAERLGLAFGTYRYRLATAIERLVDALWRREIAGAPTA